MVTSTKFMAGEPMKPATNLLAGRAVELERLAHLLDPAVLHDHHAVAQRHGLDLVVGDVDRGRLQPVVQLLELDAHLHAQLGVEVGQRLVEEEHLGMADDGAAHRHPLPLAARELARLALEQLLDAQDLGGVAARASRSRAWGTSASSARTPCCRTPSCAGRARSSGTPSRCPGPWAAGR